MRAAAELLGKFASLALIVALARTEGPGGLGVFVLALAWCELATAPIEMGFDRYLLRRVAADHKALERLFANVLLLKLVRGVPVVAGSWALASLSGQDSTTREAIYVLTVALLLESVRYTLFEIFNAFERGELIAASLLTHRLLAASLGIGALAIGLGVVAVCIAYAVAAGAALAVALWLFARRIGWPGMHAPADERRELRRQSLPFAAQDLFSVGIARVDAVLLSALTTKAIVGLYGAAYRLLEATLFISTALGGAFSAMFTYLDERSDPPVRAVFERAVKATLALLFPLAVPLAVAPEALLDALFGPGFRSAADALRLLAGAVMLLGVVRISAALVVSRRDPRLMMWQFGLALAVNVALNAALIPPLEETGAALAMVGSQLVLLAGVWYLAVGAVGRPRLVSTAGAPVVAAAAMAAVMWPLREELAVALAAGTVAYLAVFLAVERRASPEDLRFLVDLTRRSLSRREAAEPGASSSS